MDMCMILCWIRWCGFLQGWRIHFTIQMMLSWLTQPWLTHTVLCTTTVCLYKSIRSSSENLSETKCMFYQQSVLVHYCVIIGHVNVQSCLLSNSKHKPISLQYSWLSFEQPIRIDRLLCKHHWEFPINKNIIPMLTCPIDCHVWEEGLMFGVVLPAVLMLTCCINDTIFQVFGCRCSALM